MRTGLDWAIEKIANEKNVLLSFRKALRGHRCADCGIDIENAGQEVQYIDGQPYCEDCFNARQREDEEFARDMKKEEDLLRQDMEKGVA